MTQITDTKTETDSIVNRSKKHCASRSAQPSILGLLYQFNTTIAKILQLQDDEQITIEGVEDIDIQNQNTVELIQCKYHAAQKFTPSKIYEPVGRMIEHFLLNKTTPNKYRLYAYFNSNTPTGRNWITISFLEKALKNVNENQTATPEQLINFSGCFEFIPGLEFNALQNSIESSLSREFASSPLESKHFYNNAISYISKIASNPNIKNRTITKSFFKNFINNKIILFDIWQKNIQGREKFIDSIKKILMKTGALADTKRKMLFISNDLIDNVNHEFSIKKFLQELTNQYPLINKLYNTQPWTVIIQSPPLNLREIKAFLIKNKIYYNDGYEDILFDEKYFNDMPMLYKKKNGNEKIEKASHLIKLISAQTFEHHYEKIFTDDNHPHTLIHASNEVQNDFFINKNLSSFKLMAIENLSELMEILNKGKDNVR